MGSSYVIKSAFAFPDERGRLVTFSERPFWGGDNIRRGDEVFLWRSAGAEGGLTWAGALEARRLGEDGKLYLTVRLSQEAQRPLATADLASHRDDATVSPKSELAYKLYKHAHNKVAAISSDSTEFLRMFFDGYEPVVITGPSKIEKDITFPASRRRFAMAGLVLAGAVLAGAVFLRSFKSPSERENQTPPSRPDVFTPVPYDPRSAPKQAVEPTQSTTATGGDGNLLELTLVPLGPNEKIAQFAEILRSDGYDCASSLQAFQLRQPDGQDLPIFKVDCTGGLSYQLTELNEKAYVKQWTGTLFGK